MTWNLYLYTTIGNMSDVTKFCLQFLSRVVSGMVVLSPDHVWDLYYQIQMFIHYEKIVDIVTEELQQTLHSLMVPSFKHILTVSFNFY